MQNLKTRQAVKLVIREARENKNWTVDSKEPLRRASKLLDPNWKEEDYFYPGVSHESWKFFLYGMRSIKADIFKVYCQVLELQWEDIAEPSEIKETELPRLFTAKVTPSMQNLNSVRHEEAESFALPGKIAPVRNWVGRSIEIETLKAQIFASDTKAITITTFCLVGLPGIGKTSLASQLVRVLHAENAPFSAAAWETLRSPTGKAPRFDTITDSLLLTLSNGEISTSVTFSDDYRKKTERLLKLLKDKPCIVVLDNVETVLQTGQAPKTGYFADDCVEYAWLFKQLAESEHQSKVIFTSRETLAELSPIVVRELRLTGLEKEAAITLVQSFNLTASQEELVQLTDRYQGHPKALEIVSALIYNEQKFNGEVGKFLQDRKWLLIRDIDSLIDEIIVRISDWERICLSRISVYQIAEYPLDSAGISAQMPEISQYDLEENIILALRRRQLLDYDDKRASYQMHPLVQEKAYRLLQNNSKFVRSEFQLAQRQAYSYFLNIPLKPEAEWKHIEDIQPLLRAHYHACCAEDCDEAALFASRLYSYLRYAGHFELMQDLYSKLIPSDWREGVQLVSCLYEHSNILERLAQASHSTGKCIIAIDYLLHCLSIVRNFKACEREATILCYIGVNYQFLGNYNLAIEYFNNSLAIAQKLKNWELEYRNLQYIGNTYYYLGNYKLAITILRQALTITIENNFLIGKSIIISLLCVLYNKIGAYKLAIEYIQEQLDYLNKIGNNKIKNYVLATLACIHNNLGEYRSAIEMANQLLEFTEKTGHKYLEVQCFCVLGVAYRGLGTYEKSVHFLYQGCLIAREINHRFFEAEAWRELGVTYRELENIDKSLESLEKSLNIFQEIRSLAEEAQTILEWTRSNLKFNNSGQEKNIKASLERAEQICIELQLPLLAEIEKIKFQFKNIQNVE